ncbi:cupin domain-containing protein [Blastomonas sp.]|uniref:cupin domain-containing protein n=1 Tax=Blastomonas sp. TaxID=1909299 RepID=UPI00391D218C
MTYDEIEGRIVRYADLRPCYNAFIDTRSPGSQAKENFTIIGPGVAENPDQFVHITEEHGFNIGGARQPPECVNSQHSHNTAEVFVVHTGDWRFDLGEHGDDAQIVLYPGDVISIPTKIFRGFTNVGTDTGFLWAVLGGDDPGRVLWAPQVFEMAKDYGLVLLENGLLADTAAGDEIPPDVRPMPVTSRQQVEALHRATPEEAQNLVVRDAPGDMAIIGPGAPFDWPHGFTMDRIELAGERYLSDGAAVLFVQSGTVQIAGAAGSSALHPGDTMTVPAAFGDYSLHSESAVVFKVRRSA